MSIRDTSGQDHAVAPSSGQARKRRHRLMGGAIAVGVLLLGGWLVTSWSAGSHSYASTRVRIATVTRGDLVRDIATDGRVIAANSPTLYAIAGGTVSLNVVAGDVVKKGAELAVIDSPVLRSQLAQEQATLASLEAEAGRAALDAQVALSAAQRAVDQAGVERQAAARDLQRYTRGYEGGAVSQIDVARADDALKKAEMGLTHARREFSLQGQGASLDRRNKQLLADRQRSVASEVQRQVDALTLRAPFDGQVGQVLVEQRANVVANAPVLGVVDLSRFEVEVKVPESFARDLVIGMSAQLTGGSGTQFPGQISAVSPEVVKGEVVARIRFSDQQPPGLRQSQRMSTRILLDTREDVLKVERGPFVEQSGGRYAYVVTGSNAVRRPVQTGVSSLGEVEIVSGLQPGDQIVVSGSELFGDNERVSIN